MATKSEPPIGELVESSVDASAFAAPIKPWTEMLSEDPSLSRSWHSEDWTWKTKIDFLVSQYLKANPNFVYPPSGDVHPSILAIGTQMQGWLTDALGGVNGYWRAMFSAAQEWFANLKSEPDLEREFRVFCHFFDMPSCLGYEGDSEYQELYAEYLAWRQSLMTSVRWQNANAP